METKTTESKTMETKTTETKTMETKTTETKTIELIRQAVETGQFSVLEFLLKNNKEVTIKDLSENNIDFSKCEDLVLKYLRLSLVEKKVVDGKEYTIQRRYHSNGRLCHEDIYVNGKQEGLQKEWYDNGQSSCEDNFVNGKEEGLQKGWYDNGQLWYEYNYVNGEKEGLQKSWYDNGQSAFEENYVNGKKEGLQKEWSKEGVLTKTFYKDGVEQLPLEEKKVIDRKEYTIKRGYHCNGKLWYEYNYFNDETEGIQKGWYDNGQLCYEYNYVNGEKEGVQKSWTEEGILTESFYKDGIKKLPLEEKKVVDGKEYTIERRYHCNGKLWYEENLVNGKKEGIYRNWWLNGQLRIEYNYINNKLEGIQKGWYDIGKLHYEFNYVNGKLEGIQREWSEEGILTESFYKDGVKQDTLIENKKLYYGVCFNEKKNISFPDIKEIEKNSKYYYVYEIQPSEDEGYLLKNIEDKNIILSQLSTNIKLFEL